MVLEEAWTGVRNHGCRKWTRRHYLPDYGIPPDTHRWLRMDDEDHCVPDTRSHDHCILDCHVAACTPASSLHTERLPGAFQGQEVCAVHCSIVSLLHGTVHSNQLHRSAGYSQRNEYSFSRLPSRHLECCQVRIHTLFSQDLTTDSFYSIFGRIIPGALIVLALGIPASSNAAYITFAGLYGFASGAYVSLLPAQIAQISKVEQIGVRVGVTFACVSFAGLVGSPIAGAIVVAEKGGYRGLNIFSGVMLMAGAIMFTLTRFYIADWKLMKRV
jgi:hypothetical protein